MTAPRLPFDRRRLLATICIAAGALPVSAAAQNGPKRRRLPEAAPTFEADAARLVALIRRLDPRLGVVPGVTAKRPAKVRRPGTSAAPKRKHFMLE